MRVRAWLAAAAVLVAAGIPALAGAAGAVFHSGTSTASSYTSDTLNPPTGFTATRTCAVGPTFVDVRYATTTGTTLSFPRPASVQPGYAVIVVVSSTGSEAQRLGSDNWVPITSGGGGWASAMLVAKIAGSSEPAAYTFTGLTSGASTLATMLVYKGVSTTTPFAAGPGAQQNATASTTITAAAMSPATAPTKLVSVFAVSGTGAADVITPSSPMTAVGSTQRYGTLSIRSADRTLSVAGSSGNPAATVSTAAKAYGFSIALNSNGVKDGSVQLAWTPTTDTYATGYTGTRSDIPGTWATAGPRTLSSYLDTSLAANVGATYTLRSIAGNWRSAPVTASVSACP